MNVRFWFALCFLLSQSVAFASHASTSSYEIKMYPASGSAGQSVTLTCGFHAGSCGNTSGDFLDWDNTSTSHVYFRGTFKRNSGSSSSNYLVGRRKFIQGGSNRCDIQEVEVAEKNTGKLRAVMKYYHISMNSTASFPIATSSSGKYNSKFIGTMINDSGCGDFNGTHVHAGYTSRGTSSRSRNTSKFPSRDYCEPSQGTCDKYKNNSSSNWTHRFKWTGP